MAVEISVICYILLYLNFNERQMKLFLISSYVIAGVISLIMLIMNF